MAGTATERGGALTRRVATRRLTTETKHSSKTTEFYAYVAATVGVLLAGLLTKAGDGHDDRLNAHDTWLIVGILTVGYMISRGLAKSGSRDPYFDGGTNDTPDADGGRFDRGRQDT
ncbi:MAG: sle [Conexibacter sp.]|nr:sle [Conexibacter sp.]